MKLDGMKQSSRNKPFLILLFFLMLMLIAFFSVKSRQSSEKCRLDGTAIVPITRVVLVDRGGEESLFCSLCCAKTWIENHTELSLQLKAGEATLTLVDEISGLEMDGSLAYWVESSQYSMRENKCRVHVFSDKQAASKYLRLHQGRELPGYLAGQGLQLAWATDFVLPDLSGQQYSLSTFRGKIVFLRFWSLKNPFVETDLQNLQEGHDRFAEQDFMVVAVNVEDKREDVIQLAERLQISFPMLLDPNGTVADRYQITGFPTGFLIDQSGIVDSSSVGELSADLLAPFIYSLR